jgi:spore germination cell wall hydrolase CwlJ-like protein
MKRNLMKLCFSIVISMCCVSMISKEALAKPNVTPQIKCMMDNIYHEARGEGVTGMMAVASVVLNRSKQTGKDICKVVYERLQFSWTSNPALRAAPIDADKLNQAFRVSKLAMSGKLKDVTHGATHFHARKVKPSWSKDMVVTARIKNHIFYRKEPA